MKNEVGPQTLMLLSGGIDSAACLNLMLKQGFEVSGFFVDYGQEAAEPEAESAERVSSHYRIDLQTLKVSTKSGQLFTPGEIRGRNAFLIFSALMYSGIKTGIVVIGVHDGTPYFDCSTRFINATAQTISESTSGKVKLIAPFEKWMKPDIIEYCKMENVPIHLTYSCEAGKLPPCGICNSCLDRQQWLR